MKNQIPDHIGDATATIHVHPRNSHVVHVRYAPGSPEQHKCLLVFVEPAYSRIIMRGVGQNEGIHIGSCREAGKLPDFITFGIDFIQYNAYAMRVGLCHQGMQKTVIHS